VTARRQAPMPARRFLAAQARAGNGLGYLSQPDREFPTVADPPEVVARIAEARTIRDEPEALDTGDYRRHIDKRAKLVEDQRQKFETKAREQARRLMNFEERLTAVREQARRRHIDISSEVRLLRHMRQSAKRIRHLEQRLGALERRIWRDAA
jgi:predicted RNase H-like nuclease (RuvC/YqgF family)